MRNDLSDENIGGIIVKSRLPKNFNNKQNDMAEKLQDMQAKMQERTAEIEKMTFSAKSGGGAVEAVVMGNKSIHSLNINPEVASSGDIEMLQDLIISAVNEALHQADKYTDEEIDKITKGFAIPGLF
jgi:hypothetical protein